MAKILPELYRQLEYLESSGTQWINTGITAKATQGIHIKFAYMSTENETSPMSASSSTSHNVIQYYNGNNNIYMGSVTASYGKPGTQVNTIYDLWINQDINNPSAVLNEETLTLSSGKSNTWTTINVNWGLFARNNNGTFTGKKVKIYEEQINDNNTIVQHLIPAKRISDSVLGMYDLISKQFFTNSGTGTFSAGPVIDVDVNAYDELEYIQSSGTQYIDTGIAPNGYYADFCFEALSYITYGYTIGSELYASGNRNTACIFHNNTFGYAFRNTWGWISGAICSLNTKYHVQAKVISGDYELKVDGTSIYTSTESGTPNTNHLVIFGNGKSSSATPSATDLSSLKMYPIELKDTNNQLTRNFIPARRKSDSAIGMVDTLTDTFYANAGTGTFIAGPSVNSREISMYKRSILSSRLPAGYTELEYIESSGTQYIDTGIDGTNRTAVWTTTVENLSSATNTALISNGYASTVRNCYGTFIYNNTWTTHNTGSVTATGKQNIVSTTIINTSNTNSTTIVVDGVQSSTAARVYDASHNMANTTLFASKVDASTMTSGGSFKLYSATCVLDDILVRNFIPAKNSSNVVGMYDTVTNTFFTNQGTGDFIAGPEAPKIKINTYKTSILYRPSSDKTGLTTQSRTPSPTDAVYPTNVAPYKLNGIGAYTDKYYAKGLPDGYKEIQYLETDGTCYMDTGIVPTATMNFDIGYLYPMVAGSTGSVLFGARSSSGAFMLSNYHISSTAVINPQEVLNGYCRIGASNRTGTIALPHLDNVKNTLRCDASGYVYLNGNKVYSSALTKAAPAQVSIYLFKAHITGSGVAEDPCINGSRIYYFKLEDGGIVKFNGIPCKNSSNVVGMYDLVTDTFFTNAGTGAFIAGPEVQTLAPTIIRKVGVKVLDGTENWTYNSSNSYFTGGSISSLLIPNTCICTHYIGVSSSKGASQMENNNIKCGYSGSKTLYLKDYRFTNVPDLKAFFAAQYAQGHPVVIYYPLATNVVEQAPLARLNSYKEVVQYRP